MSLQKDAKLLEARGISTSATNLEQNIDLSDIYYKNNYEKFGRALIFNQIKFENDAHDERVGAEKDAANLKRILECYGFDVKVYPDETKAKIKKHLIEASKFDFENYSCLIVIMMSHGDENKNIHAYDGEMKVDLLWKYFTGDRCESLRYKPKLFFIQACRGNTPDFGTLMEEQKRFSKVQAERLQNNVNVEKNIPIMADILVMFSSADGFPSFRESEYGSWFIEALCKELERYLLNAASNADLMTILTGVNRYVAYSKEVYDPNGDYHGQKQMPVIMSMLTKIFNLNRS